MNQIGSRWNHCELHMKSYPEKIPFDSKVLNIQEIEKVEVSLKLLQRECFGFHRNFIGQLREISTTRQRVRLFFYLALINYLIRSSPLFGEFRI